MKKVLFIALAGTFYALFTAMQNADGTYAVTRTKTLSKDLAKNQAAFPDAILVDNLKGGTNFVGTLTEDKWSFTKVASTKSTSKTTKAVEAVALEGTDLEGANLVLVDREGASFVTLYTKSVSDNVETYTKVKNVAKDRAKAKALYPTATVIKALASGNVIVRTLNEDGSVQSELSQTEIKKATAQAEKQAKAQATAQAETPTEQVEQTEATETIEA